MNIRKPTDYSALFSVLDELMTAHLSQMELYCGIGRLVNDRPEKGAAVAAAEYLQAAYPDAAGFSHRNLRRMRDFYRTYESAPEAMATAMTIGWTQNIIILETKLTLQEKWWYIRAVQQFGWSKLKLAEHIASAAHLDIPLDLEPEVCYTEENNATECMNELHPVKRTEKKHKDFSQHSKYAVLWQPEIWAVCFAGGPNFRFLRPSVSSAEAMVIISHFHALLKRL